MLLFLVLILAAASAEEEYLNSSNICQRCTCTNAQIYTLDCTNQNFTKMLAMWPLDNTSIRAIFTGNNFDNLEKLPPTTSTVEIVLSKCNIHTLDPAVFETSMNIKLVDLSHNFLTSDEVSSEKFRGPFKDNRPQSVALETLDLSYNQIHTIYKNVFDFFPNLTELNLEGNDFKVLDMQTQLALAKVPNLRYLNLANNELLYLVSGAIQSLNKLKELDLSNNDLDFVPHSLEVVGQSLEVLTIDGNPIIEMTEESFKGVPNLVEISANNLTRLKRVSGSTFVSTVRLVKLSLCNNSKLVEVDAEAFGANSTLKELYMSNNSLTTIPPNLLDWSTLTSVDISDNPLTCSALSTRPDRLFNLTRDICAAKVARSKPQIRYQHISIPLAGLIVSLMVAIFAAAALAYSRYKRFIQGRDNPFATQVIYSPLLHARS